MTHIDVKQRTRACTIIVLILILTRTFTRNLGIIIIIIFVHTLDVFICVYKTKMLMNEMYKIKFVMFEFVIVLMH